MGTVHALCALDCGVGCRLVSEGGSNTSFEVSSVVERDMFTGLVKYRTSSQTENPIRKPAVATKPSRGTLP